MLDAGATVIHVDVMDGHFVPPITMGPLAVTAIADQVHAAGAKIDVHLMIERPERQVEAFAEAGADSITIHAEATPHLHYTLQAIKDAGCLTGLALNPGTPAEAVGELDPDMVLCMTVNPGWGGQKLPRTFAEQARAAAGPDRPGNGAGSRRRDRRANGRALRRGGRHGVRRGDRGVRRRGPCRSGQGHPSGGHPLETRKIVMYGQPYVNESAR